LVRSASGSFALYLSEAEELARYTEIRSREKPYLPELPDYRRGYRTIPGLVRLLEMSEEQLGNVREFTVSRPGFGSIMWYGTTDIRGISIAKAVEITDASVQVYHAEELAGTKPKIGQGLNKRALVTLLAVFPENYDRTRKMKTEDLHNFIRDLKDICR
jgi:hypothetical protein